MAANTHIRRELAHRTGDGISVWLFWDAVGDTLTLEVHDEKFDEYFELEVPRDSALDAYRHPFAYLVRHRSRELGEPLAA